MVKMLLDFSRVLRCSTKSGNTGVFRFWSGICIADQIGPARSWAAFSHRTPAQKETFRAALRRTVIVLPTSSLSMASGQGATLPTLREGLWANINIVSGGRRDVKVVKFGVH